MEFHPPIDDIIASLKAAGVEALPHWDEDFARQMGGHFGRFATGALAPLNATGDLEGCRFENGRVYMPAGFKEAYAQLAADGWQGLTAPEEHGGQGLSAVYLAITSEIFSAANHSLQMITALVPGAIRTLLQYGSEAQRSEYIPRLASGKMLATMCLTEASAGSDLSAIRTHATRDGGAWALTGEKIFISGGDQDLSEDIFHLVLARTSDDGLRGLSLFIVKGRVNVTRIEEKMGIHASPTCAISFDAQPADLIGGEGQGLAAMFTMMDHARIDVALQGVAHAARAHDIAKHYAGERLQGGVAIDQHADVRRMLDEADQLAKNSRAIAHLALVTLEGGNNPLLVEFLTPLAKIAGSNAGIRAAELALQVMGGYGYLHEYGIEQIYRDARICSIYEGTNGIHERNLATRAIKTGAASAFDAYLQETLGSENPEYQNWLSAFDQIKTYADPAEIAHSFTQTAMTVIRQPL